MAQAELETEIPLMKEIIRQEPIEEVDLVEEDIVTLQELETLNENDVQDQNRYSHIPKPKKGWCSERSNYDEDCEDVSQGKDPYDNFMRKHLQHYGYFTGRNASFRSNYDGLENWHRNYDLRLSGTQSLSVAEEQLRKMGHHHAHKNSQLDPGMGQFFAEGQPPDDLLSRTTQLVFHYQAGKKIPKLREPRNLYALTKEPGPQQATRWPSHMQVICSPIHFIDYIPPVPEPFYIPTGKELTPSVRGTPNGEIVFLNDPGRDGYFMRSRVAGCRLAMRNISVTPRESVDDGNFTLEFESRFESGNLLKVVKINNFEYELTLRPDVYTDKHTQWYFFRVRNMVPDETYRFTIVNLMKPSSLYNNGMKTLFYSEVNAKKSKIGWTRAGSDIRYYRNNLGSMNGRSFYSLTWTIKFPHKDDTCYFAHCYPYTYTDLQEYLLKLANDPVRSRFCKQRVLCRTLAGNLVYILTVTSPSRNPEIARVKKAVVLTARVHPGETNASWMMKGFLDFLSGNFADAKLLRDNFIFKIVPMLNPDGVIVGNYRCSLAGRDLNRNYKSVLKDSFPSVWHLKMMVKKLNMEREVILYCDLHGHSRKNNIFIYGCENKNNPQRKFRERIFPLMLAKNSGTKFSYESCKFKIQKSKEGTGRVVMWCMGIMNSYTMEATFGGTSLGSRKGTHFSTKDFEEMGHNFCDTLLDYCDPDTSKVDACYQEIQDRVRKQILKRMQMRNISGSLADVDIDDYSSEYESDTSGSDSSCDDGLPVHLLAIAPKLQRKRRLKTRRDRNKQTARKLSAPVLEEQMPTPIHGPKPVSEKSTKLTRYSHTAGGKRREDIIPSGSIGTVAQSAGYHNEGRVAKQSDYLEALTTAYIRSGVLMVQDKKNDYSMRYTNGMGKKQDSKLAVEYLANQLGELTAEEQYEILRRSALRRQLSPAQQRVLAQRHLVAVAQLQQRREQTHRTVPSASEIRRGGGTPIKQHPNPFDEKAAISGRSRANSRCASASQKQESRKTSLQSVSHPGSQETNIRSAIERPNTTSDKSSVPSGDSTVAIVKKTSTVPPSTETTIKDEELIAQEQAMQKTIKQSQKTSNAKEANLSINFCTSNSMHTPGEAKIQDPVNYSSMGENQRKISEENSTVRPVIIFDSPENALVKKMTPNNTTVTEDFLPMDDVTQTTSTTQQPIKGSKTLKKNLTNQDKAQKSNPIFGESLALLPEKQQSPSSSPTQKTRNNPNQRTRAKPTSQASLITEDPNGENDVSLDKIPQQWGGRKQVVIHDMQSENSPEPVKRERHRVPSAKRNTLSNVIAEGHSSRFRAKSYQGSGDGEKYFGMSDNVGPAAMKYGERVPPIVANIAELRRSLMGQGREGREDEHNAKGSSPSLSRPKSHRGADENNANRRRTVNLRPRAQPKMQDFLFEENEHAELEYTVTYSQSETDTKRAGSSQSVTLASETTSSRTHHHRREGHGRHHGPPTLRHNDYRQDRVQQSSSDIEDFVEEKWPILNESEIRSYSQGNATIEKLNDHSVTSIRFGSHSNDQNKRLGEQWIDVRRRQVVSTAGPQQNMLAVSSVSLNMDAEIDEKQYTNTPALAKRPVPPHLRYLSAKQSPKRKW